MTSSLAGNGFDIGIEAEDGDHEGALPSLVTIAWENTDDIKIMANYFTQTRGAVAVSETQCITHKVKTVFKCPQINWRSQKNLTERFPQCAIQNFIPIPMRTL